MDYEWLYLTFPGIFTIMASESKYFHPYYTLHVGLMGSYLYTRSLFDMSLLAETDVMSFGLTREQQIFAVAGVFYLTRLPHMTTMERRIGSLFTYFKMVVAAITICIDIKFFIGYVAVFLFLAVFVKQPIFEGAHRIEEFHDPQSYMDQVVFQRHEKKQKKQWLIYCYASWADNSIQLSPVFAQLSMKYGNGKYLKFGKIDVGKHRGIANKYDISIKPNTKQLPTVLLITEGKVSARMPDYIDPQYKGKGVKKVPISVKSVEERMKLSEIINPPKEEKKKSRKKWINDDLWLIA